MKITLTSSAAFLIVAIASGTASSQTVRLNQVMRSKLEHSQKILEAVVTSNWQLLDAQTKEMARVTRDPAWSVLQFPEYARQSAAFLRATDDLAEAARLRDLEGASLGFVALSTSCVSCHRYMARSRIVSARP
jgi:hypothetical protein